MSVVIKRVWNQNKMVNIESLHGMAFQAEDGGHVFEISGVNDAGEVVPLSGTVAGVFMRPDRADIALTGAASGGVASVTLTNDCYAVPGRFGLTIFVTEDGKKTAVYAAVGTVSRTSGGGVAGDTPQSVVDLINAIEAAIADIPASYTNIMAAIALTYSSDAVYPAGSFVWNGGVLFTNPAAITTPETWTAAHWVAVPISDVLSKAVAQIEPTPQNLINQDYLLQANGWTKTGDVYTGTATALNGKFATSKGGFPVDFAWKPLTKYTIKLTAQDTTTGSTNNGLSVQFRYTDGTNDTLYLPRSTASLTEFTLSSDPAKTVSLLSVSYANGGSDVWNITEMVLTEGDGAAYAPYELTAVDTVARGEVEDIKNQLAGTPADIISGFTVSSGDGYKTVKRHFPAGVYTIAIKAQSDTTLPFAAVQFCSSTSYSLSNVILTQYFNRDRKLMLTVELDSDANSVWAFAGGTPAASTGASLTVEDFAIYEGVYLPHDTDFDVTEVIKFSLAKNGKCVLDNGEYGINNLLMPTSSMLEGVGGSVLKVIGRAYTYTMPGARSTATAGWVTPFKYTDDNASHKIKAGLYKVTVNVSTTYTGTSKSRVAFIDQSTYSASHVITRVDVERSANVSFTVFLEKGLGSVFVFAGTNVTYSEDTPVTVNSFTMELLQTAVSLQSNCTVRGIEFKGADTAITPSSTLGDNFGVVWAAPSAQHGVVTGCLFHDFDGAAILLQDTGTPVDHALLVSDCHMWNCNRGVFCRKDSEFNRYTNSVVTGCYYGFIIRGGNNYIANCGLDGNTVGISVDSDEGSNGGHGSISNCSINHAGGNTGYGLILKGAGLELVENCNFYFAKIRVEGTEGNVISNCGFGRNTGIEITGGNCNIVQGCMFRAITDGDITVYNNTKYKVLNCFYRNGNDVVPVVSSVAI